SEVRLTNFGITALARRAIVAAGPADIHSAAMRGPPSGLRCTLLMVFAAASLAACDTMWNWDAPEPGPRHTALAPLPPPGSLGRAHPDSIVVKPGQTLFDVARLYDVPTRAVIDANH